MICDYQLPGVNGVEFVRVLRSAAECRNRDVPVIMLTGHANPLLVKDARKVGVNDFLVKPVSPAMLCNRILKLLKLPGDFIQSGNYLGRERRRGQASIPGGDRRLMSESSPGHHLKQAARPMPINPPPSPIK